MAKAKATSAKEDKEEKVVEVIEEKPIEPVFHKEDIMKSNQFNQLEKDFLHAFLAEGNYTLSEARKILTNKLKGAVK